jgi:ribosomal protein S18 acetylase RimI-like enzyme
MSGTPNGRDIPKIRDAESREIPAVLALWRAADATPSVTDDEHALQLAVAHPTARLLVAEVDERIVGCILAGFDGWRGHLYRIVVLPEMRRQGIARALLAAAEAWLAAQGAKRVVAMVEQDHPLAVSFWSASGYGCDPRISRYVRNL